MLNGEGNENSKKKQTNKQQNKQNKAKIQHETSWVTCFMEELSVACVSVCFFFSLPLIFTLVATSISQFVTATIKFSCLFLSLAQSIHVRVEIKI